MDRWANKVAVVTGASSGIGERICRDLCTQKVIVVGLARRTDRLSQIQADIAKDPSAGQFVPLCCDVTDEKQIKAAFDKIVKDHGGVDILVNNAGVFTDGGILEPGSDDVLNKTFDTNVSAVLSCTRKAFQSMSERNADGYIVNISSIAGHTVPCNAPGMKPFPGAYFASKSALTAINRMIGQELVYYQKKNIRVSNISPGIVQTEIFKAGGFGNAMDALPSLNAKDVSDTLQFILSTPSHVQVRDVILEAVGSAFY